MILQVSLFWNFQSTISKFGTRSVLARSTYLSNVCPCGECLEKHGEMCWNEPLRCDRSAVSVLKSEEKCVKINHCEVTRVWWVSWKARRIELKWTIARWHVCSECTEILRGDTCAVSVLKSEANWVEMNYCEVTRVHWVSWKARRIELKWTIARWHVCSEYLEKRGELSWNDLLRGDTCAVSVLKSEANWVEMKHCDVTVVRWVSWKAKRN